MNTQTADAVDFAFDYTNGAAAQAQKSQKKAVGFFKRLWNNFIIQRERQVMYHLAQSDPRLAKELQAMRDRADWPDQQ